MRLANAIEMLGYHLKHAFRSLSRTPIFTFVMELSLGFGLALWAVARTGTDAQGKVTLEHGDAIYHVEMSRDALVPTPPHGDSSFWDHVNDYLLPYRDALALVQSSGRPHAISFSTPLLVSSADKDATSRSVRFTTAPLFSMFDRRFVSGGVWNDADEPTRCVLTRGLAVALFATADAIGKSVSIAGQPFAVAGVVGDDHTERRFYDFTAYPDTDALYVPLAALGRIQAYPVTYIPWMFRSGSYDGFLSSDVGFLHAFVRLDDAKARDDYRNFLDAYVRAQRESGRQPLPRAASLRPLADWADLLTASPYVVFQLFGLLGFVACIFNLVRLLTAKFSSRAGEVAIRRALGAPKRSIFFQHLIEAELVAIGGAVLGLVFAIGGLAMLNHLLPDRPVDFTLDTRRALLATMAALVGGLIAGFYPALRICNVAPATVLRRQ